MKKQKTKRKKIVKHNFVAKHAHMNKAATHKNKKRNAQLGKTKHKGQSYAD